jgi:hypothetical protein
MTKAAALFNIVLRGDPDSVRPLVKWERQATADRIGIDCARAAATCSSLASSAFLGRREIVLADVLALASIEDREEAGWRTTLTTWFFFDILISVLLFNISYVNSAS